MNEKKTLREQELDKVVGDGDRPNPLFEKLWADYASSHCSQCSHKWGSECEKGKPFAAHCFNAGQPLSCPIYCPGPV